LLLSATDGGKDEAEEEEDWREFFDLAADGDEGDADLFAFRVPAKA
jgi:hypothetical protein